MDLPSQLKRGISRQLSTGSFKKSGKYSFNRQNSLDPRKNNMRFSFGRQSSLDPIRRSPVNDEGLAVPENLDYAMQLLFLACKGDVEGLKNLLDEGVDVNSIDLDGRTALHIAACEGHEEVVKLLLTKKANIDARDRWGSTAAADAKYYGNTEVYNILKARGAKAPKTRKTPMAVANPREVPEYELNPKDIRTHPRDGISKESYKSYQVVKWNGTKVSAKILDKDNYLDPENINAFRYELALLEKVRHPNVVQFIGAVTQNIPMMILLEHSKDDLGTYLQKKGRISLSKVLRLALDIARGMNYLHECKPDPIIHCDLKPKNIWLDCGGQLKVAGFGLIRLSHLPPDRAKLLQPEAIDRSSVYVAPEIFKDDIFDQSVDVYSFAIMLYEMLEGTTPFYPKPPEDVVKLMCIEDKRPTFKSYRQRTPSVLQALIEACWSTDASARPTFAEIIKQMEKIVVHGSKQGWWKDALKFPWI